MTRQSPLVMSAQSQARLGLHHDLVPLDASFDLQGTGAIVHQVYPEDRHALVVGFRVFNSPRQVEIRSLRVGYGNRNLAGSRFDAAAYNLGNELPPLDPSDEPYMGELLRFCKVDWPCISPTMPLSIEAAPFAGSHLQHVGTRLDAVLIVRLHPDATGSTPYLGPR